jgi:hypothetical protein
LDAIVDTGKGREAEKRRQVCTAMFRWACHKTSLRQTIGLKAYDRGTPRDRVLTVEEIETLWKWLDTEALSLDAADILKLELLTGARCGEISGLRAEEIDRQKWIWTLPAARSKNGRQRVTPILGAAREILEPRLSFVDKGPLFVIERGAVHDLGSHRRLRPRAFCRYSESDGDSRIGWDLIQPAGWGRPAGHGETVFSGSARPSARRGWQGWDEPQGGRGSVRRERFVRHQMDGTVGADGIAHGGADGRLQAAETGASS